ncbi:FxsA family protein [Gammaproteobacteria bacterium]
MSLLRLLPIILLVLPIADIVLLVKIGGLIGVLPTIALVLLAASAGGWLLRRQGLATLDRVQESVARGELPAAQLLEGIVLLLSAALFIAPGFLTDLIAVIGLIPPLRRWLVARVLRHGLLGMVSPSAPNRPGTAQKTIEGEFWRDG